MPLVSVIVLCYRNFEFIYEAIDSVCQQTYENIELIVTDDGSANFPQKAIKEYIEKKQQRNIKSVIVRQETQNCGTVRHLNHNIKIANGEYICFLAADDTFYDCNTISKYIEGFGRCQENCQIEMAHTAMYDRTLTKFESYYLNPVVQSYIDSDVNYGMLFRSLCYSACLPTTSTCYKKSFFDVYGLFDETYKLVEDYPIHCRIASEKIPLHFENFVAAKHRDGGISHGAVTALSSSKIAYFQDLLHTHQEIMKNIHALAPEIETEIKNEYAGRKMWIEAQIYGRSGNKLDLLKLLRIHPMYCLCALAKKMYVKLGRLIAGVSLAILWLSCLLHLPILLIGLYILIPFDLLIVFGKILVQIEVKPENIIFTMD